MSLKKAQLFRIKSESTTKCQKHLPKVSDFFSEQCNIPFCAHCVSSSREHQSHTAADIAKGLESKQMCRTEGFDRNGKIHLS